MKNLLKIGFISILTIILFSCNKNETEFLNEQKLILESQFNNKLYDINILSKRHITNYKELFDKSAELSKLYNQIDSNFVNNKSNILKIVSYYNEYKTEAQKTKLSNQINEAIEKKDDRLEIGIKNQLLIMMNEILHKEMIATISKRQEYYNIEPYVDLEKKIYNIGDTVRAKILVKSKEISDKLFYRHSIIILGNDIFLDSFDNNGDALYYLTAREKGKFIVRGKLLFQKTGITNDVDSLKFNFEYEVK